MLPPLVQRELRVALFRRGARRQWLTAAWMAVGLTLAVLFFLGLGGFTATGRPLFLWLFFLASMRVVRRGFSLTADLFSEERRNNTLGLIVLTGLSPLEILICKLLGAILLVAYGMLGGLPFFTIPILIGGVLQTQVVWGFVFLANLLFFCVAIGLLASVLHRDGGQAHLTAQAIAAILCLTTPGLYWLGLLGTGPAIAQDWLALSPLYPAYLVVISFSGAPVRDFWFSGEVTLGYSCVATLLAAIILQRTWREGAVLVGSTIWREKWRRWLRSGGFWRGRLRRRLLDGQPFSWLAARDQMPVLTAYGVLVMAVVLWLIGLAQTGARWLSPFAVLTTMVIIHYALNLAIAYAAARTFAEERLSGGFEVLLTTPLKTDEVVQGQLMSLALQFRTVVLLTLLADAVLCGIGFHSLGGSIPSACAYLITWTLLLAQLLEMHRESALRSMWISAWTGRPGFAALRTFGKHLWLVLWGWVFSLCFLGGSSLFKDSIGLWCVLVLPLTPGLIVSTWLIYTWRVYLKEKLIKELRRIASAPIPSKHDKRFIIWSPHLIQAPGPWGDLMLEASEPVENKLPQRAHPARAAVSTMIMGLAMSLPLRMSAADWPQWRGPDRDGIWHETGIIESFPTNGLRVCWRVPIGRGWSSPVVAKGRVYVSDVEVVQSNATERVLCFDETSGKLVWTHSYVARYPQWALGPDGGGPRATPIVRDGKLYNLGGLGRLLCLDATRGKVVWERDLAKDYEVQEFSGITGSPLIEDDLLILNICGKPAACVVAFNCKSGKEAWKALDDSFTYSSPIIVKDGGCKQLIVWSQEAVTSLDPRSGRTYWREVIDTPGDMAVSTPVFLNHNLLVAGLMFRLEADKPAASVLWPENRDLMKRVLSNTSTALLDGEYVYSGTISGDLVCLETRTGKELWRTNSVTAAGNGSSIHITPCGDAMFLFTDQGDLVRAKLSPQGYRESSRAHVLEPTSPFGAKKRAWVPPAYANRHAFVRNDKELICVSLEPKP
jgi:outer membrane protein assembly factor BamB